MKNVNNSKKTLMSYNRNCFEHLRESRKQQRKLVSWKCDSIYVDVETGEIISKYRLRNGEYIKIKSNTKIKTNENGNKSKTITTECRANQSRLFEQWRINQEVKYRR